MKSRWQLISHEANDGKTNLEKDARLLDQKPPEPVLRFYSWSFPCVSYGYFQPPPSTNLPAYRRVTGGGTVFHDKDLTYSLVYPRKSVLSWNAKAAYLEIHTLLYRAFQRLGVHTELSDGGQMGPLCFQSPVCGDLLYQGKKIAGASQRRKGNYLLHQGSILVEETGLDRFQLMDAITKEFEATYPITFVKNPSLTDAVSVMR